MGCGVCTINLRLGSNVVLQVLRVRGLVFVDCSNSKDVLPPCNCLERIPYHYRGGGVCISTPVIFHQGRHLVWM